MTPDRPGPKPRRPSLRQRLIGAAAGLMLGLLAGAVLASRMARSSRNASPVIALGMILVPAVIFAVVGLVAGSGAWGSRRRR